MIDVRDLLVIVPSRGRPGNVRRLREALAATGAVCDFLIAIDDDDPTALEYSQLPQPPGFIVVTDPRRRLGPTLNVKAVAHTRAYRNIGFMGDDHCPQTWGWDRRVVMALQDTPMCYGNDLLQGRNLPTAVFMRSQIIQKLGYMCPPEQTHLYLDDFWLALGGRIGITYMGDVIIEHLHPGNGKAPMDASYAETGSQEMYAKDKAAYERYLDTQFEKDVAVLCE